MIQIGNLFEYIFLVYLKCFACHILHEVEGKLLEVEDKQTVKVIGQIPVSFNLSKASSNLIVFGKNYSRKKTLIKIIDSNLKQKKLTLNRMVDQI